MPDRAIVSPPERPLVGAVRPPGSKSLTNRALLLAGLATGRSTLSGVLRSDDTRYMAAALAEMGVAVRDVGAEVIEVIGTGALTAPTKPLFLGNAGTATRFLTAAAALASGRVVIDGDAHMRKRPIAPLVEALQRIGVAAAAPSGAPPVTIDGVGALSASEAMVDAGLSSQYLSALLMIAPFARDGMTVRLDGAEIGARGYVDLTLGAMEAFGAEVSEAGPGAWRVAPTGYRAADYHVEPDASAATYLWGAEALTGGRIDLGAPAGAFTQPDAASAALFGAFPEMPAVIDGGQMQDAVPALAAVAVFNKTPVRFVGIENLRVKECDRTAALATEIAKLAPGLAVEEGDDLVITPQPLETLQGAEIETYSDHRIAMSLALLGLKVPGVTILDPGCVAKTYPGFWEDFERLGARVAWT